ncbi:MAG: hypothetical protein LUD72_11530 [Bacteroidales bacterium]|nr:hypothetical protein [Bacteroidales bacterium]
MKFQKWLCLCLIIVGALMIVYACLWKTGMLAALGTNLDMTKGRVSTNYEEQGMDMSDALIFFDTESYNTAIFWLGIVSLLAACLLYVFANHKRRNYYLGNYVMSVFVAVVDFAVALVTVIFNSIYLNDLIGIKNDATFMENWEWGAKTYESVTMSTSNGMFAFGYIVCALLIAGAVFLILNMLWKRNLMRGEKQLLERSFAEEVA